MRYTNPILLYLLYLLTSHLLLSLEDIAYFFELCYP